MLVSFEGRGWEAAPVDSSDPAEYLAAIATSFPSLVFPSMPIIGFGEVWRNHGPHQGSALVWEGFPYRMDRGQESSEFRLLSARGQQLCTQRLELGEVAEAGSDGKDWPLGRHMLEPWKSVPVKTTTSGLRSWGAGMPWL